LNASASGIAKSFALMLIAAIPALHVNATTIPFGNVVLNAPQTQSMIFKSTVQPQINHAILGV
jgi:hypothetical protein